jgi:hypothetical protein
VLGKELALSTDLADSVEEVHRRYQAVKEVWECRDVVSEVERCRQAA